MTKEETVHRPTKKTIVKEAYDRVVKLKPTIEDVQGFTGRMHGALVDPTSKACLLLACDDKKNAEKTLSLDSPWVSDFVDYVVFRRLVLSGKQNMHNVS